MYSTRFTGIGRYVYELTQNLFKIDKENEYVLFFLSEEYEKFNPPNERIKKVKANIRHYSFAEQIKFLKILNKEKLDLMHFTHFNAPILYSKPSIVTIHDLTLSFFPGKKLTSIFHRIAYQITIKNAVKKAKKIIAVSNNTKKDIINLLKIDPKKIETIYEGVNEEFKPALKTEKKQNKIPFDKPYLLYTGVWRSHKNLINLIKAFKILKEDKKFEGRLVITGRNDPFYARDIIKETILLNLDESIYFTGFIDEKMLIKLYQNAMVYVFPSLYEGFGLPPLEAMQCGTPVSASNRSCIPEICGDKNAVFFDPTDPSDIAEKTFKIINENSFREELIKNGLNHIKKFSWEKMAENTYKIYKSFLY